VRLYPLNQQDIPNEFKVKYNRLFSIITTENSYNVSFQYYASTLKEKGDDLSQVHPLVDYTPPSFIKLLFTDLGILTPSAVSDELIKLYPSRY
jgi:translation initiation factor eIF-2B subunit alpha